MYDLDRTPAIFGSLFLFINMSTGQNGKGSKWRKTNWQAYREGWDYIKGLRCEYHHFVRGKCTHCGKNGPMTAEEATNEAVKANSSIIIFGH
jgi:hypothetical protein